MSAQITIGLPFLNPGPAFALTLRSIFAQSFQDWELLLVDDGTTDASLELATRLKDPRVRLVRDGERRGLSSRLNQIARLAETPFLARMDADDLMHPRRLELQVAELRRGDANTVVGCDAYSMDADSRVVGYRTVPKEQRLDFSSRQSFIHPSVAASTDWFRRNPYTREPIFFRSEDAELWCRTTASSRFVNLSRPLLFYREAGVFSFRNYAGSQLGILALLHQRFARPRGRFVRLLARELLKVWVAGVIEALGGADRLVARRSRRMDVAELREATEALERIRSQALPLDVDSDAGVRSSSLGVGDPGMIAA
jgi:glycosyltransferase involved in cell wall biosynthesis